MVFCSIWLILEFLVVGLMRGVFINLDRCHVRKNPLLNQLELAGLPSTDYLRFSAHEPIGDEDQLLKGLTSKGELGIFRSLAMVLEEIGKG